MGIKGIDHWVIVAGDLQRTLNFYERLGFKIAWETRPGRPDMATIRIGDAQKINVHGPEAPARAGYLGARRPTAGALTSAWNGTGPSTRSSRCCSVSVSSRKPDPARARARAVCRPACISVIPTTTWSSSRCTTGREHGPALRRSHSFHEHDRRDRVPALAAHLPGARRAPQVEWRRQLLAEPGRRHRLPVALAGDGEGPDG